jgi:hypothetical protein
VLGAATQQRTLLRLSTEGEGRTCWACDRCSSSQADLDDEGDELDAGEHKGQHKGRDSGEERADEDEGGAGWGASKRAYYDEGDEVGE